MHPIGLSRRRSANWMVPALVAAWFLVIPNCTSTVDPGADSLRVVVTPAMATVAPGDSFQFSAAAYTRTDDLARVTITWSATAGSMRGAGESQGQHYAWYRSGQGCGDRTVIAAAHPVIPRRLPHLDAGGERGRHVQQIANEEAGDEHHQTTGREPAATSRDREQREKQQREQQRRSEILLKEEQHQGSGDAGRDGEGRAKAAIGRRPEARGARSRESRIDADRRR